MFGGELSAFERDLRRKMQPKKTHRIIIVHKRLGERTFKGPGRLKTWLSDGWKIKPRY